MPPKRPQKTPPRRSGRPSEGDRARARQRAARETAHEGAHEAARKRSGRRGKKPPRTRWQKTGSAFKWGLLLVLYGVIFLIAAVFGGTYAAVPILPKIEHSSVFSQKSGVVLARDNKTVLRELRAPTSRRYVRDGDVPQVVLDAVVAAEDRRFYDHGGLDPRGIVRAAVTDLRTQRVSQGASTITQQLVKNAYVGPQKTVGRKTREALLALALDQHWSKQRIITAYLNTAYFGQGAYGAIDGSRTWFGRRLDELDPAQAALLAGLLQSPEGNNPLTNPAGIMQRRNKVLRTMNRLGTLPEAQLAIAVKEPIPDAASVRRWQQSRKELAPHFTDDVIGQLVAHFGTARALGSGMRVTTTLDANMQRKARKAVNLINGSGLSAALVTIDVRSGQVRALALGGPAAHRAFDVAILGHRQPGSAFKPFTLAAALEHGYSPASIVTSAPYHQMIDGKPWIVHTAEGAYAGKTRLDRATWHSDNTVYARVAYAIGLGRVIDAARRAGVTSQIDKVPATVLGALPNGVTPMEIAAAYATFARGGMTIPRQFGGPAMINRAVQPGVGQVLTGPNAHTSHERAVGATNALDPSATASSTDSTDTSYLSGNDRAFTPAISSEVTTILRGVIREGTATRAQIGRPAAGKTGTTENYVDAWFVGYTPELVTAVWVGNTAGAVPMRTQWQGGPVFGGTYPAEIWASFMGAVLKGRPVKQFAVVQVRRVNVLVDPASGLLADRWCAGAIRQSFIAGTEPTNQSTTCAQKKVEMPNVLGKTLGATEAIFAKLGINVEVTQLTASPTGLGTVVQQIPSQGQRLTRTSVVRLFVPVSLAPPTGIEAAPPAATKQPTTTGTTPTTGTDTTKAPATPAPG